MVAKGVFYVVFLLPIAFSIFFGSVVMADVLQEPDRELDMWPFEFSDKTVSENNLKIIGIQEQYSTSDLINIKLQLDDFNFDCGDLYITIYNIGSREKEIVTQSGYFSQCFGKNEGILPIDDEFTEIIDIPGSYELVVEIKDQAQQKSQSVTKKFTVQ